MNNAPTVEIVGHMVSRPDFHSVVSAVKGMGYDPAPLNVASPDLVTLHTDRETLFISKSLKQYRVAWSVSQPEEFIGHLRVVRFYK